MKGPTNIALLALVALAAVVAERAFVTPTHIQAVPAAPTPALEGRILSVDPPAIDRASSLARKARVKLGTGEIVAATIGGCVVLPGQTARLLRYGSGSSVSYVVGENGRNDS